MLCFGQVQLTFMGPLVSNLESKFQKAHLRDYFCQLMLLGPKSIISRAFDRVIEGGCDSLLPEEYAYNFHIAVAIGCKQLQLAHDKGS